MVAALPLFSVHEGAYPVRFSSTTISDRMFTGKETPFMSRQTASLFEIEAAQPPRAKGTGTASGEIESLDRALEEKYQFKIRRDEALSRSMVSFQANKARSVYRWYKYKEAFSAGLVEFLLARLGIERGVLLDPFAGSGTALFASSALGLSAHGIELLPIGQEIISARMAIEEGVTGDDLAALIAWLGEAPWRGQRSADSIPELRITRGAYPPETAQSIAAYLAAIPPDHLRLAAVLRFALLCVLEAISYTRKDGQYLRWDYRSGRRQGRKRFDKGRILSFDDAISAKIREIHTDIRNGGGASGMFGNGSPVGRVLLDRGSSLTILPSLPPESFDCVLTSPPYCNRYDYTRTYALELALLGIGEAELRGLRQELLSCTVENRSKNLVAMNPAWRRATTAADQQKLLQTVLSFLDEQRLIGALNNNGIPRMVKGYFYEMACVIQECLRVLKPGAPLVMVNDNVRYAGASIAVDLILSDLAAMLGFDVEHILILPKGKGNSSQQMGAHGREPLRKCVYLWRKPR